MLSVKNFFVTFLFCLIYFCNFTASAAIFDEEKYGWELLNDLRAEYGISAVYWNYNSNLQKAAEIRAQEIASFFSHQRSDGSDYLTVVNQCGVRYSACGENIAMGTNLDAEGAMNLWRNSKGHLKNMVNRNFSEVGIAAYRVGENIYWVQLFVG